MMTTVSHDLIDTTEMYLRVVLEMEEDGVVPMRARIVEALGHSGPTVSQTVARMHRDGLVDLTDDRRLQLTDEGRRIATAVLRKHRLVERLLVDVIGLELDHAHEEACRGEHVVSDRVEARLVDLLGDPDTSPFGNPIPTQADGTHPMGPAEGQLPLSGVRSPGRYQVARLGEPAQSPRPLLVALVQAGVVAGAEIEVTPDDGGHLVCRPGGIPVRLEEPPSRHVLVQPLG
jgi:DtxR family Mn-dependent transcriptional regulator